MEKFRHKTLIAHRKRFKWINWDSSHWRQQAQPIKWHKQMLLNQIRAYIHTIHTIHTNIQIENNGCVSFKPPSSACPINWLTIDTRFSPCNFMILAGMLDVLLLYLDYRTTSQGRAVDIIEWRQTFWWRRYHRIFAVFSMCESSHRIQNIHDDDQKYRLIP